VLFRSEQVDFKVYMPLVLKVGVGSLAIELDPYQ
jgi:hypothetical protein